ncbi:MAG: HNH endonuclease, partial [Gordonia sp. (in: high G+C Gram-positive bacteria)]
MTDTEIAAKFEEFLDTLADLAVPDEIAGPDAHAVLTALARLRNVVDDQCAQWVRQCDRLGVAQSHGRTIRELLLVMGFAPAVASRMIRRTSFTDDRLDRHCADGAVSAEHADAIVRGVNQVAGRVGADFDAEARSDVVNQLLAQHFSGATPAEIGDAAKSLGNRLAADAGGPPAAEDRRLNRLALGTDDDGRTQLSGNLHAPVGEK